VSEQEENVESEKLAEDIRQIKEMGSVTLPDAKHVIHCLNIIGQVEGHYILPAQNKTTKYEHIIPALVAIEQDRSIEGLVIILNTVGGDVEAGLAIAELIASMKTPTVSMVVGGGHSIGVPLAVCAKKSFIVPSATMTIHPVRMNGLVLGVPQTLSYFDKMQERIVRFVCDNSAIKPERFRELMMSTGELVMDVGSVIDGEQAVKDRSAASDFLQFSPFPLLHDFQTIPPYMAEQKQHPHTCGLCFGQCRTKLRLCADIWPHLGDAFHLNHESHCAPIPCPLRLR